MSHRRIEESKGHEDEVAIMPPPAKVAKSHPDYFTIDLPFYFNHVMTITNAASMDTFDIRLDSPWDPLATGSLTRDAHQPLGRDTWGGIYDYYRVLETDINLTFSYVQGKFGDAASIGSTAVPFHALVGYTLLDDETAKPANACAFVEMKHTKVMQLHPINHDPIVTTTGSTGTATRVLYTGGASGCSYHFDPRHWDLHVVQSGIEERWTAQNATPTNKKYMQVTCAYPNNNTGLAAADSIRIAVDGYITYKVQWREINTTKKITIDTDQ